MRKLMAIAEVEFIRFDANDIVTASLEIIEDVEEEELFQTPIRFNYRGMPIDWDDQEW